MTQKRKENLSRLGVASHIDNFGRTTYRPATRTENYAPVIMREYQNEEVDQDTGESSFVRMYECEPAPGKTENRHFLADVYDQKYKPNHNKKMHPNARCNSLPQGRR